MNSKEKQKFRATKEWKSFCLKLKEERGLFCECCGCKSKRLQTHHIKPFDYTNLDPNNFVLLCSTCHQECSKIEKIKQTNYYKYNNKWLDLYLPFITPRE